MLDGIYLAGGVRTPIGKFLGGLSPLSAVPSSLQALSAMKEARVRGNNVRRMGAV